MKTRKSIVITLLMILLAVRCAGTGNLVIKHEINGPIETNCYLIYDDVSKEAALIDLGGPVDSLVDHIRANDLQLKYIFCTHGHPDHVFGMPGIRGQFPEAKVCIHKLDYDDMFTVMEWAHKDMNPDELAYMLADSAIAEMINADPALFGTPDIYLEDGQTFELGSLTIKTIHSPGHSPGSVCFYTGNSLFSGDVLFHRSVGRTDVQHSSSEDQVKSVRRLYSLLPDSTIVYPGHMEFTDIGSEKTENKLVTVDSENLTTK